MQAYLCRPMHSIVRMNGYLYMSLLLVTFNTIYTFSKLKDMPIGTYWACCYTFKRYATTNVFGVERNLQATPELIVDGLINFIILREQKESFHSKETTIVCSLHVPRCRLFSNPELADYALLLP